MNWLIILYFAIGFRIALAMWDRAKKDEDTPSRKLVLVICALCFLLWPIVLISFACYQISDWLDEPINKK